MWVWLIVGIVAFGISVFLNIELWSISKELKAELIDLNGFTNYDRPTSIDNDTTN